MSSGRFPATGLNSQVAKTKSMTKSKRNHRSDMTGLLAVSKSASTSARSATLSKSTALCAASSAQASPEASMIRYLRDAPFYHHPFIGCKTAAIQLTAASPSYNGAIWSLAPSITQGVADNQRTGDVIRLIGATVRLRVDLGSAAAPASNTDYQVVVAYSPLSSLAVNQIFQDVGTVYSGMSPADWDYNPVIMRLRHAFDYVDTYHPLRVHDMSFKCNELINYEAGASTVATGSLVVAAISSENPAAPTQVPTLFGLVQLYYQDV